MKLNLPQHQIFLLYRLVQIILPNDRLNLLILQKSKLINKKYKRLKLLGLGDIKEKLDAEVNFVSNSAKEKIEKLGGKVTLIK